MEFHGIRSIKRLPSAFIAYAYGARLSELVKNILSDKRKPGKETQQLTELSSLAETISYIKNRSLKLYAVHRMKAGFFNPERTALFVGHELSLTGAPNVMLRMAEVMKNHGWSVILLSPSDGKLGQYAEKADIPTFVIPDLYDSNLISIIRTSFQLVVVNTILPCRIITSLCHTDTKVIWWIHEAALSYGSFFAKEMPRKLTDNIHVYCGGEYPRKILKERFPLYKVNTLIYYSPDLEAECRSEQLDIKKRLYKDVDSVKARTYVLAGTIGASKGQDVLAQSIVLLSEKTRKNSKFVFVGSVKDEDIKNQIIEVKDRFPETVILLDELDMEELHNIYWSADYLICASRMDPLPVVVAEALSLGKPVICSTGAGSSLIIEKYNAGFVYEKNDPKQLRNLIETTYVLGDDEYKRLSANARKAYEGEFSKPVFEMNLIKILERLDIHGGEADHV